MGLSTMKERHKSAAGFNARCVLHALGISLGADFHTLSRQQVEGLLAEARRVRYQRPPKANGGVARYYHDLLQRQARW